MKKTFVLLTTMALAAAVQAVEVGKPAPDFTGTDINGKAVKLSDYKGKMSSLNPTIPTVLIATINTKPAPCRHCNATSRARMSCGCW